MATDSLHMKTSSPSNVPATNPDTRQMAFSHSRVRLFKSSMPSINMLLPRETMKPSTPAAIAAVLASASATRQAMFLNGTSTVHSQV